PLAAGKLVAINGDPPQPAEKGDRRAGDFIEGEVRASWSARLPEANRLLQGRWFDDAAPARPAISVEQVWVDLFGLKLGDTLTLRFGDREIVAEITSLRKVEWDSFRANFFLMLDPATGAGLPHSMVASFHLDGDAAAPLAALSRDFPNL